jgi:hypothetical protein
MHALTEHQFAEFNLEAGRINDAIQHLRAAVELYSLRGESELADQLGRQVSALEARPSG